MFGVRFEMDNFAKYREMKTGHEVKNQKWGAIARSPACVVKKRGRRAAFSPMRHDVGAYFCPTATFFPRLFRPKS